MIKHLLLIGALTFTLLGAEDETTPPTQETEPTDPSTDEGKTDDTSKDEKKEDETPSTDEDKKEDTSTDGKKEDTSTDDAKKEDASFDWKAWLEQWFTPSQVAMIMTWITYAGTIIGLIYKVVQLSKSNTLTAENVKTLIMKELGDKVDESVKTQLESAITSLTKTAERQNEVLSLLAKVSALSQENTPESRVAILDLISRLGVVEKVDIDTAKEVINKEVEEKKAKEEETNNTVDAIIENHKEEDTGISI